MEQSIKNAILHVRSFFPEVSILAFNSKGLWQYMTSDFESPNFEGINVDVSILETAADSVVSFPAIFELPLEDF